MIQAVILAAGRGRRLEAASNGTPKCLLRVGDRTLVEHQIAILNRLGIDRICLVVGHEQDQVRAVVGNRGEYVVNQRYAETNSLYSLQLVRNWVRGSFVLMNCDLMAHPDVYHRVLAVNGPALAFDSSSGHDEEHMKITLHGEQVRAMGKTLPAEETHGENVGILKFDGRAADLLFEEVETLNADGGERQWAPAAVDRLARRIRMRAVDVADLPWTEIDFPEDLRCARQDVWPLIETGQWQPKSSSPVGLF